MSPLKMAVNVFTLLCIGCHLMWFVSAQVRFGCPDDYCAKKAAPCSVTEDECENGMLFKNATTCGCCHICVKYLKEKESCKEKDHGSFNSPICGPKLTCNAGKCVKVDTQCVRDLEEFQLHEENPFGRTEPKCDDLGFYNSTVCISDILCYCVDKHGKRIFGTDVASRKQDMNCSCSREYEKFSKRMEFDKGDFLRCRPNGDYDVLQCTDKSCYCMTEYDGEIDVEDIPNAKNLKCYSMRHKTEGEDKNLTSKCWRERTSLLDQIKDYEKEELSVIGVDLPECDLDGSYAPVQSKKNISFCVSREGKILEETTVLRNSESAKKMNCRCVRDKEMLRNEKGRNENMNTFAKFKCTSNGDYESKQRNAEGLEITVDSKMGYQIR